MERVIIFISDIHEPHMVPTPAAELRVARAALRTLHPLLRTAAALRGGAKAAGLAGAAPWWRG